jgi:hypothetical protein
MTDRLKKLGSLARFVVRYEVAMYVALLRWIARRPAVPRGSTRVSYHKLVTPVLALWIFASLAEVPVFHVITPWESVRIALLAISVWGAIWMIGYFASLRVYPHLVSETTLTIRYGAITRVELPWSEVESVTQRRRDTDHGRAKVVDDTLVLPMNQQVNLRVTLPEAREFRLPRRIVTVRAIELWADEPQELLVAARTAVTGRSPG